MKVALCDDNKFVLQELKQLLRSIDLLEDTDMFSALDDLFASLERGKNMMPLES